LAEIINLVKSTVINSRASPAQRKARQAMFKMLKHWLSAAPTEAQIAVHDPEVCRTLNDLKMKCQPDIMIWAELAKARENLQDLLTTPTISENDFIICRRVFSALLHDTREIAVRNGVMAEFDRAREFSEQGIDFAHYVINPLQALAPEAAVNWGLDGITADGRRVFPLLQKFMPDAAEELVEARLAAQK
jgi:hypothetical protein